VLVSDESQGGWIVYVVMDCDVIRHQGVQIKHSVPILLGMNKFSCLINPHSTSINAAQ